MNTTETTPASGGTPTVTSAPGPRRAGRPSTVDQLAAMVMDWLRVEPTITGAQALQRARTSGYRGGKSAFYDLVRRVRLRLPTDHRAA